VIERERERERESLRPVKGMRLLELNSFADCKAFPFAK
jgi:hypothetical protein